MSGNVQNLYQGRILCCNYLQRCSSSSDFHAPTFPFLRLQMVWRCSCTDRIPGHIWRPWGGHVIVGEERVVALIGVLLDTRMWRGKFVAVQFMTPIKWSFYVYMAFFAKLWRWPAGGTSFIVMWVAHISFLFANNIPLLRTWCFGTIPWCFILDSDLRRAKIISLSVLFFIGSIQVEFPSIPCRIVWYQFPLLDLWGNFPV